MPIYKGDLSSLLFQLAQLNAAIVQIKISMFLIFEIKLHKPNY